MSSVLDLGSLSLLSAELVQGIDINVSTLVGEVRKVEELIARTRRHIAGPFSNLRSVFIAESQSTFNRSRGDR